MSWNEFVWLPPPMTELEAAEILLGKPPEVQRLNAVRRQLDEIAHAAADGRLREMAVLDNACDADHQRVTFRWLKPSRHIP